MSLARAFVLLPLLLFAVPGQAADDLVMGVFPRFNATETVTRYKPLADHLAGKLRRKVVLETSKDFQSFWKGVEEQRYDVVQYNQLHYIRSAKTYQVVAHNKEFGRDTLAGTIYVRKDSGIRELAQLRGRTVLFGGSEDAMIGYIANVYMLLQAGVGKDEFKTQFAVNPVNSVIGVYHRQADAAGSGDNVIGQPALKSVINTEELVALSSSEQLLHLPWAVKRSMPARLREAVQSSMVNLESSADGKAILKSAGLTGIGKAEDKDYDPHRRMVRAVLGPL